MRIVADQILQRIELATTDVEIATHRRYTEEVEKLAQCKDQVRFKTLHVINDNILVEANCLTYVF